MSIEPFCLISCKVIPKASKSAVVGWEEGLLKVRLAAVPEKGKANEELIRVFAAVLKIAKRQIEIVSGDTSRQKRVRIHGLTEEQVRAILDK